MHKISLYCSMGFFSGSPAQSLHLIKCTNNLGLNLANGEIDMELLRDRYDLTLLKTNVVNKAVTTDASDLIPVTLKLIFLDDTVSELSTYTFDNDLIRYCFNSKAQQFINNEFINKLVLSTGTPLDGNEKIPIPSTAKFMSILANNTSGSNILYSMDLIMEFQLSPKEDA